jgi:hypothetical protein
MDHNEEAEEDNDDDDGVVDIQQRLQLRPIDGMQQRQHVDGKLHGEEEEDGGDDEDDNRDVAVDKECLWLLLMMVIQPMEKRQSHSI